MTNNSNNISLNNNTHTAKQDCDKNDDSLTIAIEKTHSSPSISISQTEINLPILLRVDAALNPFTLRKHGIGILLRNEKDYFVMELHSFYHLLEHTKIVLPTSSSVGVGVGIGIAENGDGDKNDEQLETKEQILLALLRLGNAAHEKLYRLRLGFMSSLSIGDAKASKSKSGRECVCLEVKHKNLDSSRIEILKKHWHEKEHQDTIIGSSNNNNNYINNSSYSSLKIQDDKHIQLIYWHRKAINVKQEKTKTYEQTLTKTPSTSTSTMSTSQDKQKQKQNTTSKKRFLGEPYIHSDMSLRERVRVRAKLDSAVQDKSKSILTSQTNLLQLADALRSYARMKQSRSSALALKTLKLQQQQQQPSSLSLSKQHPSSQPFINISFKELVVHLNGAIFGSTFGKMHRKRATKKEVSRCLVVLAKHVPLWLTVLKNNKSNTFKDFVMKIHNHVDYQSCVTKALGGRICQRKERETETLKTLPSPQNQNKNVSTSSNDDNVRSNDNNNNSNVTNPSLSSASTTLTSSEEKLSKKRKQEHKSIKHTQISDAPSFQMKPKENPAKKMKLPIPNFNIFHNENNEDNDDVDDDKSKEGKINVHKNTNNCKRLPSLPQCQSQPEKNENETETEPRINTNLRFCDADYNGVDCNFTLTPTYEDGSNASPRGLKRLFSQLNSGQRI